MNDRADFLMFFLKHQEDLRAFIGSLVRDGNSADDVLQDVALTAWERFDDFDRARSFGAWARGIAVNKIMRRREQNARFPAPFSPEAITAILDAFNHTEENAASASTGDLEPCIERLPEKSRQLLALRYGEALDVPQVAERLSSTTEAVYKALVRVRRLVRDCIESRRAAEGRA